MKKILSIFFTIICLHSFSQEIEGNIYAIDRNRLLECDNSFLIEEEFIIEYKWSGKGEFIPPEFNGIKVVEDYAIQSRNTGSSFQSMTIINGKIVENINND